jgi:hypothetical protein
LAWLQDLLLPQASFFKLEAAVHLAARIKVEDAAAMLRRLESFEHQSSSSLGEYGPGVDLKEGDISPKNFGTNEFRRIVHLSLRRLGEKPAGQPVLTFKRHGSDKEFASPKWDKPRFERVDALRAEMKPVNVLITLGPPDYVERGQNIRMEGPWDVAWRYDIDAASSYTLLLVWDAHKIKRIEKITPALWKPEGLARGEVKPALIDSDGSIRNAMALYSDKFAGKITRIK